MDWKQKEKVSKNSEIMQHEDKTQLNQTQNNVQPEQSKTIEKIETVMQSGKLQTAISSHQLVPKTTAEMTELSRKEAYGQVHDKKLEDYQQLGRKERHSRRKRQEEKKELTGIARKKRQSWKEYRLPEYIEPDSVQKVQEMLREFEDLKLDRIKYRDDKELVANYQANKIILYHAIQIGRMLQNAGDNAMLPDTDVQNEIRNKVMFCEVLDFYMDLKMELINNPYYSALLKRDTERMDEKTIADKEDHAGKAGNQRLAEYLHVVGQLRHFTIGKKISDFKYTPEKIEELRNMHHYMEEQIKKRIKEQEEKQKENKKEDKVESKNKAIQEEMERRNQQHELYERRREAIRNLMRKGHGGSDWRIGDYADLIDKEYGNELCKIEELNDVLFVLERINDRLKMNEPALERFVNRYAEASDSPIISYTSIKDRLKEQFKKNCGINMIMEEKDFLNYLEQNSKKELDAALGSMQEELQQYQKRYQTVEDSFAPVVHSEKFWENQEVIRLLEATMSEEEFQARIKKLEEKLIWNLELVKESLEQNLSVVGCKIAMDRMLEKNGTLLLFGKPKQIELVTRRFVMNLSENAPQVLEYEKSINEAMKENGVDACWKNTIYEVAINQEVTPDQESMTEIKRILNKMAQFIKKNENEYTSRVRGQKWSRRQWERLESWCRSSIKLSHKNFKKNLDQLLNEDEFMQNGELDYKSYIYGQKAETVVYKTPKVKRQELLKGEDLCLWKGFRMTLKSQEENPETDQEDSQSYKDVFEPYQKKMMESLNMMIKEKKFSILPFMDEVQNLEDLEDLTKKEYDELLILLRNNLLMGVEPWTNLHCMYADEFRMKLLPELLEGKLTTENFDSRAEELIKERKKIEDSATLRYYKLLGSTDVNVQESGSQYLYTQSKADTSGVIGTISGWFGVSWQSSVQDKRNKRFRNARVMWDYIREKFKEEEFLKLVRKRKMDEIYQKLRSMTRGLSNAATEVLDQGEEEFIHEFMLCGLEDHVFSEGCDGYQAFMDKEDETYQSMAVSTGYLIADRLIELNQCFKENRGTLLDWDLEKIKNKLKPLIAGLEPVLDIFDEEEEKEVRRRNFVRFGVESWDMVMDTLVGYLFGEQVTRDIAEGKEYTPKDEMEQDMLAFYYKTKEAAELYQKRTEQLRLYSGGLFTPVMSRLERDSAFWADMMSGSDKDFENALLALKERIGVPLRLLKEGGLKDEEIFFDQLMMKFGDEILTKNYSEEKWKLKFEAELNNIRKRKSGGVSVYSRLDKVEKEHPLIYQYLYWVFQELENPADILLDDSKLDAFLEKKGEDIEYNIRIVNNLFEHEGSLDIYGFSVWGNSQKALFKQYIGPKVVRMSHEGFRKNLPKMMREFKQFDAKIKEPKTDDYILNLNKDKAGAIEARKMNGRCSIMEASKQKLILYRNAVNGKSVILAALGKNKMLKTEEVEKAKKEARKKTQLEYGPEMEEGSFEESFFTEIQLSKRNDLVNQKVLKWYRTTREQIEKTFLQDKKSGFDENQANALITFMFLQRERKLNLFNWTAQEETKDRLMKDQEEFLRRGQCLAQLQKMLHDNVEHSSREQALQEEIRETINEMKIKLFGLSQKQFERSFEWYLNYFTQKKQALQIYDQASEQAAAQYGLNEKEKEELTISLQEYYELDVRGLKFNQERMAHLLEEIAEFLKDEDSRYCMIHSTGRLGQISYDQLNKEERYETAMMSRTDFEERIAKCAKPEQLSQYNQLDAQQRQIFALILTVPGQLESVPAFATSELVSDKSEEARLQFKYRKLFMAYINHQEFHPVINYNIAAMKLIYDTKYLEQKLNPELFQQALDFTKVCIHRYEEQIPKDYERLNNGEYSFLAGKIFSESEVVRSAELPEEISNADEFIDKLLEYSRQDGYDLDGLLGKYLSLTSLKDMTPYQKVLLVTVLQDRTVMDLSTRVSYQESMSGAVSDFVNGEKRQELIQTFSKEDDESDMHLLMNTDACTKAMYSLFSFQIKDNVDLRGRSLGKEDFEENSLGRKTVIDWSLLDSALDLVRIIENKAKLLKATYGMGKKAAVEKYSTGKAFEQYRIVESNETKFNQQTFDYWLRKYAREEKQVTAYAGYLCLDNRERDLFIKALCNRNILDISDENYYKNLIGIGEREYVDAEGRDELIEEYLYHTMGEDGGIEMEEDNYKQAVLTLFTRQIYRSTVNSVTGWGDKYTSSPGDKNKAVDWDLVSRALQFVRRVSNERRILHEDRELYYSQGNLAKNGRFEFDSEYLRKNLTKTGYRPLRYILKRLKALPYEIIPDSIRLSVLALLPRKARNSVNGMGLYEADFEEAAGGMVSDNFEQLETVVQLYSYKEDNRELLGAIKEGDYEKSRDVFVQIMKKGMPDLISWSQNDVGKGIVSIVAEGLESAENLVDTIAKYKELNDNMEETKESRKEDDERIAKAQEKQDKKQQELSRSGADRNRMAMKLAGNSAKTQLINQGAVAASELIGSGIGAVAQFSVSGDVSGLIHDSVKYLYVEGVKAENFLRTWYRDFDNVLEYFNNTQEVKKAKEAIRKCQEEYGDKTLEIKEMFDYRILMKIMGFESEEELASYVGLNVVRSILFNAGQYNTMKETKFTAIAILTSLGLEDLIGRQDSETAEIVYDALFGGEYR